MMVIFGQHKAFRSRRTAFTMLELVASMAVTGILLAASASVLVIASHATPNTENPVGKVLTNSNVVDQIARELAYAVTVSEHGRSALTFTVDDRGHGSAGPEAIRYAWSGTVGDPLTREYNGSAPVTIARDVQDIEFAYDLKQVSQATPATDIVSSESVMISHDATQNLADFSVRTSEWIAEYFKPDLPEGTTSWSIQRIKIQAKEDGGGGGITCVKIEQPNGSSLPSGTALEEKHMKESDLTGTYAWQEFTFDNLSDLSPDNGVCLVLKPVSGTNTCKVQYRNSSAVISGASMLMYNGSWQRYANMSLNFYVYGTYTITELPELDIATSISRVRVFIEAGAPVATQAVTGVVTLNQPEWVP